MVSSRENKPVTMRPRVQLEWMGEGKSRCVRHQIALLGSLRIKTGCDNNEYKTKGGYYRTLLHISA